MFLVICVPKRESTGTPSSFPTFTHFPALLNLIQQTSQGRRCRPSRGSCSSSPHRRLYTHSSDTSSGRTSEPVAGGSAFPAQASAPKSGRVTATDRTRLARAHSSRSPSALAVGACGRSSDPPGGAEPGAHSDWLRPRDPEVVALWRLGVVTAAAGWSLGTRARR